MLNGQVRLIAGAIVLAALGPSQAFAQAFSLEFTGGLVTLHAENVSLREIIDRWSDQGGVIVSNREGIATTPITLHLVGVPERQVLATLLRDVSGYILGPQRRGASSGATIDRILLLPTSSPPPLTAAGGRAVQPRRLPEPVIEPPMDEPSAVLGQDPADALVEDFSQPQIGTDDATAAPGPRGGTRGIPSNPFGAVGGSDRPGTIAPVPPNPSGGMRSPSETVHPD